MHVLMVLYNPPGKGTYWRALYLARSLAERGHRISFLSAPKGSSLRFRTSADSRAGVTLVESPSLLGGPFRSGWDPYSVLTRVLWSVSTPVDIIHGFESRPTVILPVLRWRRRLHVPVVLDWCDWFGRGGAVEERTNPLLRMVLRPVETFFEESFRSGAAGATVINEFLRQRALALGVPAERVLHIPNGCNVTQIRPPDLESARDVLGLPSSSPLIGYLGAAFASDARLMVEAFRELRKTLPEARLLLIGNTNQPWEQLLAHPNALIRTGSISPSRLMAYLSAVDVCWLVMRRSGANRGRVPMKLTDYMSAGRPVVVTDVGDVGAMVRQGAFGLVSSDTPSDLAANTLCLLQDDEMSSRLGLNGRRLAETQYSWATLAARLDGFYRRILDDVSG